MWLIAVGGEPFTIIRADYSYILIFVMEFLCSALIALVYYSTTLNEKAERAVHGFAIASTYAFLTLTIGCEFYSKYNFLWLVLPSVLSFKYPFYLVSIINGGILGPIIAALMYKHLLKESQIEKDLKTLFHNEENEIEY